MEKKEEVYPKITVENFEDMYPKLIDKKDWDCIKLKIKPPKNLRDFREATRNIYGVELSVDCLAYPEGSFGDSYGKYNCQFEVCEREEEYKGGEIYKLWEDKLSQYDGLRPLLNTTFGRTFCGGVARSHYGQTECDKKTWERIRDWDNSNDVKVMQKSIEQARDFYSSLSVSKLKE